MGKINPYYVAALGLVACGIALFALDVRSGNASAGIILIIPFVIGGGAYSFLGLACIIGAFFLSYLGMIRGGNFQLEEPTEELSGSSEPRKKTAAETAGKKTAEKTAGKSRRYGGVVLLGPFPIIFGSDKKSMLAAVALAIVSLVITFILLIFILRFWR